MDMPALVERYLEIINDVDFHPFLVERQNEPLYGILAKDIVHNDPDRTRYFFNDIVAFHVVPELITAYVAKGYYDQALAFVDKLLENPHLSDFWKSIKVDTGLNYYERAVYTALFLDHGEKAFVFLEQMQLKLGFKVNRLSQCARNIEF
ncbi:hypothetical protein H4R34_005597, partial [Dimargaris verticillata]